MKSADKLMEIAAAMRRCREEGDVESSYLRDWADRIEEAVEQLGNEAVDREIDAAMAETDANVMRGVARELAGMDAPDRTGMCLPWKLESVDNPVDRSRTVDRDGSFIFGDNCGPSVREAKFIIECVNKVHNANGLIRKLGCWYAEKEKLEDMVAKLRIRLASINFNYCGYGPDFNSNKELIDDARKLLEEYKDEAT